MNKLKNNIDFGAFVSYTSANIETMSIYMRNTLKINEEIITKFKELPEISNGYKITCGFGGDKHIELNYYNSDEKKHLFLYTTIQDEYEKNILLFINRTKEIFNIKD